MAAGRPRRSRPSRRGSAATAFLSKTRATQRNAGDDGVGAEGWRRSACAPTWSDPSRYRFATAYVGDQRKRFGSRSSVSFASAREERCEERFTPVVAASPAAPPRRASVARRAQRVFEKGLVFSPPATPASPPPGVISYTAVSLGAFRASPAIHHSSWVQVWPSTRSSRSSASASSAGSARSERNSGKRLCTSSSVIGCHGLPFPNRARHTTPPVDGLSFARADGRSRSRERFVRSADDPPPVASREDGPAGDARPRASAGSREEPRHLSTCALMSCFGTCASHTGQATNLDFVSARRRWASADVAPPDCRRFIPGRRDAHGRDARAARIGECRCDAESPKRASALPGIW